VRPVLIMVGLVGTLELPQMGRVPDEGAVQGLAAASADPAFDDRVHPGCLDAAEYGLDPGVGEDGIECGGEVRAAVADHDLIRTAWSLRSMIRLRACWVVHSPTELPEAATNPRPAAGSYFRAGHCPPPQACRTYYRTRRTFLVSALAGGAGAVAEEGVALVRAAWALADHLDQRPAVGPYARGDGLGSWLRRRR
jgi:hypothetical protein